MEFDLILPLNRKQILLDWINTIDEPRCLLVSGIEDLQDGNVFIEILKNFLKSKFEYRHLVQEMRNLDKQRHSHKQKLISIFDILLEFVDESKVKKFSQIPYDKFVNSETLLLDFTHLLKNIHSGKEYTEEDEGESVNRIRKSEELDVDENEYNYEVKDSMSFNHLSERTNKKVDDNICSSVKKKNFNYNFKKNFESDRETSDNGMEQRRFTPVKNKNTEKMKVEMGISNVKFDILREEKKEKENKFDNTNINISSAVRTPPRKINSHFNINTNTVTNTNMERNDNSFTLSVSNTRSVSPAHSNITGHSFSNTNLDFNKVYSKREKAELNLLRGIPSGVNSKKPNYIEINNHKINFYRFIRPTNPIVNVDFSNYHKYQPNMDFIKNSVAISKKSITKHGSQLINKTEKSPDKKIEKDNKPDSQQFQEKFNQEKYNQEEESNHSFYTKNTSNISSSLKNKIYFWLIDLNILKENSIRADDLPSISANGVLLADLINRLEGRSESIKGIIRKTTIRSHIQVNINKVLEHLRGIGKINSRHLWSNNEIASGEEKTVWELLDDIWHYYSNKNSNIKNQIAKRKIKSSGNISSIRSVSPLRGREDKSITDNSNNINSIPLPKPMKNPRSNKSVNINTRNGVNNNTRMNSHSNTINNEEYTTLTLNDNSIDLKFYPSGTSTRAYAENLIKVGGLDKYTDVANYQKEIKHTNSIPKRSADSVGRNINAIANCLGMDSTRAKKKRRPLTGVNSTNNSDHYLSNNLLGTSNILSTIESKKNTVTKKANSNLNTYSNTSRANIPTGNHTNNGNRNGGGNTKSPDKSCFIIFQKSNVKKLKKEIERYNSQVSGYQSENSIFFGDENPINNTNQRGKTPSRPHYPTSILDPPLEDAQINYRENKSFTNQVGLLSTDESSSNLKKKILTPVDKDEINIKEWLMGIGIKPAREIDFTREEINDFEDGLLLTKIISVLENRKIAGINPNPRSTSASLKNITKCLEILRNKKNMPYDFLWSEEEINRGNGHIIRELLKQIRKVYSKESEYLHSQNFETFNN